MTAEIAIINKSAVALAADSAVTISTGTKQEKIFNTEDKLFELCNNVPIGIMIYNGMSFASAPIQILIRRFRAEHPAFDTVEQAASTFLKYLLNFGLSSPQPALDRNIRIIVQPVFSKINEKIKEALERDLPKRFVELSKNRSDNTPIDAAALMSSIYDEIIDDYVETLSSLKDVTSLGG